MRQVKVGPFWNNLDLKYYLCVMENKRPYNEFSDFCGAAFLVKCRKYLLTPDSRARIVMEAKVGADARIVTIRHLVRNTVIQKRLLRSN